MSTSRDQMIAALREFAVPRLRQAGFRGSYPHFCRARPTQLDLLNFQFSSWGGAFVVEVAHCAPTGFTTRQGKLIPAGVVRVRHIHPAQRLRLGSHPPEQADHWLHFEPERAGIYADKAREVVPWLQGQAEEFWRTHQPAMAERA